MPWLGGPYFPIGVTVSERTVASPPSAKVLIPREVVSGKIVSVIVLVLSSENTSTELRSR